MKTGQGHAAERMVGMAETRHFPSVRYVLLNGQYKERIELNRSPERTAEDTAQRYGARVQEVRLYEGAFGDIEVVWLTRE
jgi:hypothetical protein